MTQHTQPVGAGQHQHQQHQQQTSTPQQQQQHQTTTTPNTNNNNTSNNNNSSTTPTTTNNNQTQTVAVQQQQPQHQQNNNNNYQSQQQNATGGQIFNPQIPSANVYVPTLGMPAAAAAHHPQQHHHHQPGAMYQTMIPAAIPSNVYVNNVTANVNLHGWPHTVPHGAWVHPGGTPHYIHGDSPSEQNLIFI
ncbi:hypothetical protein FF38_05495 [Lucilia cuprina]|uniref:Uncharacterized protein n=1 Tax=Lucilia cuprina TaxID=7375 RepID=A0A0L0C4S7_LUCCU|nr:hypothetical protein FF38_05495 [Lucilia cuprina]